MPWIAPERLLSQTQRLIATLLATGAYIVAVVVLTIIQGVLDAIGLLSFLNGVVPFLILHIALLVAFFLAQWRLNDSPAYREARARGLPARAQVLEVQRTRWRRRQFMGAWTYEYLLWIQLERPGEPDSKARLALYLPRGTSPPAIGDEVAVLVHPEHPAVVVPMEG